MRLKCQRQLPKMVATGHAPASLAGGLDSWQQQRHQNPDDADDDQQFDDRKCLSSHWHSRLVENRRLGAHIYRQKVACFE